MWITRTGDIGLQSERFFAADKAVQLTHPSPFKQVCTQREGYFFNFCDGILSIRY